MNEKKPICDISGIYGKEVFNIKHNSIEQNNLLLNAKFGELMLNSNKSFRTSLNLDNGCLETYYEFQTKSQNFICMKGKIEINEAYRLSIRNEFNDPLDTSKCKRSVDLEFFKETKKHLSSGLHKPPEILEMIQDIYKYEDGKLVIPEGATKEKIAQMYKNVYEALTKLSFVSPSVIQRLQA